MENKNTEALGADEIRGFATTYVWSLDGDGMSTARGVRTREALTIAFIEGYKKALQTNG